MTEGVDMVVTECGPTDRQGVRTEVALWSRRRGLVGRVAQVTLPRFQSREE